VSVTCDRSVDSSTNKTDRHNIAEILLKVALSTKQPFNKIDYYNIYCNTVENEVKYPYRCPIVDANIINNVSIVYLL